jgi:hypothetical protein
MDVPNGGAAADVIAPHWIEDGSINRWRYKAGTNREDMEIELTQNKEATCCYAQFELVQRHKWHAHHTKQKRSPDGLWYALTRVIDAATGKQTSLSMHALLYPRIVHPLDHIDHNGLNNRPDNVRSGSHGVNERNRQSAIGVYDEGPSYNAHWDEFDGKGILRRFYKSKYGSDEEAYAAALACRTENATRVINEKLADQIANPIAAPVVREFIPGKQRRSKIRIPVKGLSYHMGGYVNGEITISGIKYAKLFALHKYDNSLEQAVAAGTEWANHIRTTYPRKKKAKTAAE